MSNETKFTPGPWTIGIRFDCHAQIICGHFQIARTECSKLNKSDYVAGDENRANAALIAAAPELYAVLSKLRRSDFPDYETPMWNEIQSALKKARDE